MKLNFNGGSYKVILPKQIIEKTLKWGKNVNLNVECDGKKIIITKGE